MVSLPGSIAEDMEDGGCFANVDQISLLLIYSPPFRSHRGQPHDFLPVPQDLALAEGALPRHLHTALFTQSADGRLLTHRQLSRQLITLWCTGHQTASELLARTVVSSDGAEREGINH